MLSGCTLGRFIRESRSVAMNGPSPPGAIHTFSVSRTKGRAAMRSTNAESLQDTVTKFSHLPVTTIFTPCLRISSTYLRHTGRSVESIGRFCLRRRSIAFSERNASGCSSEYVVAALSFRLMRYFKVSCRADAPTAAKMKSRRKRVFSYICVFIIFCNIHPDAPLGSDE